MEIPFTKMHGCGNDYIYIDCTERTLPVSVPALARKMSKRRFSVGADGVILICPSAVADAKMRIFNLDGSEGKMCGNGIRCVGKYLYETKKLNKTSLDIETLSGIKHLELNVHGGRVRSISVNMGRAELSPAKIPMISPLENVVFSPLEIGGETFVSTCLSIGNPHAVLFISDLDSFDIERVGRSFERAPIFPEGVNTEFCRLIGNNEISMRVFERGSGETLACGTGACASAVAAALGGFCGYDEPITVHLAGGDLTVYVSRALDVVMKGDANKVFEGVYDYERTDQ